MAIKNYTTGISAEKTVAEIESMLAKRGASKIMKEYDSQGCICSMLFILKLGTNEAPFNLPLRAESVYKVLIAQQKAGKLPRSFCNPEQAARIGWRILKDWVDAQLALVEIGMVKMEEVFMPYLYNQSTRQTLFQIAEEKKFATFLPMLSAPSYRQLES